jgi:hypothetical protein
LTLLKDTHVFEKGELVYLVAPVATFDYSDKDIEEFAFAEDVRRMAPNENLLWLHGQYVEAGKTNENGQTWTHENLEIASLSPVLMPVTVMHDQRSAVGLIANSKLLTPARDKVPRARIDTDLAVWQHRFPEIAEEVASNHAQGTLMQSMEARCKWYECNSCGKRVPKLPGGIGERAMWCSHMEEHAISGAITRAARTLGQVTFTGSGLIFGSHGARGAMDTAHLDLLQEEVAEFHERQGTGKRQPRTTRRNHMEIEDSKYQELVAKAGKVDDLSAKLATAEETAAKVPELTTKLEQTEAEKKAAEAERDDFKKKHEDAEETAAKHELSKTRLGGLGKGFTEKLGEFTRGRLEEQAGTLTDEEWDGRLQELEETAGVKRDAAGEDGSGAGSGGSGGSSGDGVLGTREETARSAAGNGGGGEGGGGGEPTDAARRSVVGSLVSGPAKKD